MQNSIRGQGHSKALLNDNHPNLLHLGTALCDVKIKFIQFCNHKISGTGLIFSKEDFELIQNAINTSKKSKMNIIFLFIYKE